MSYRKKSYLFLVLIQLFFLAQTSSQHYVDPYMIEVPTRYNEYREVGVDTLSRVTVNNFFISQYPESVGQYKKYIDHLIELGDTMAISRALPNKENIKSSSLSSTQLEFIYQVYLEDSAYDNYPMIALDYEQIREYLMWKVNALGRTLFQENGYDIEGLTIFELMKLHGGSIEFDFPVEYLLPLPSSLISAWNSYRINTNSAQKIRKKIPEIILRENSSGKAVNEEMLKELGLRDVFAYGLGSDDRYRRLTELVWIAEEDKNTSAQLTIQNYGRVRISYDEADIFLTPWRTWSLKIK